MKGKTKKLHYAVEKLCWPGLGPLVLLKGNEYNVLPIDEAQNDVNNIVWPSTGLNLMEDLWKDHRYDRPCSPPHQNIN